MDRTALSLCPRYHQAVEIIGRRWSGAILLALLRGASRFGEIRAAIPQMSDKMLAERLKEFEAEGIVERSVSSDPSARVEYRLSEKGQALEGVVASITAWAHAWMPEDGGLVGAER